MSPIHESWKAENAQRQAKLEERRPGVKKDYVPAVATDIRKTLEKACKEAGWPEVPR